MGMTQIEQDVARSTLRKNNAVVRSLERIDWEQRRYEIAKEILLYCAETTRDVLMAGHELGDAYKGMSVQAAMARQAVIIADALVAELKGAE